MTKRRALLITIGLWFFMNSCAPTISSQEQVATFENSVDGTVQAELISKSITQTVVQLSASPTSTKTPTATATPTSTPTPTGPIALILESSFCFSGPGNEYVEIAEFSAGDLIPVAFLDDDNDYVGLIAPDLEDPCWMALRFLELLNVGDQLPHATPPPTPTPSLTPTPNIVWRGDWAIWVGPEPLTQYALSLTHDGLDIRGAFDAGSGNSVSIVGTLSSDYSEVSGIWTSSAGGSGTFTWQRGTNPDQFIGNQDNGSSAWCGARGVASLPFPCFK